jgi:uncharacterized Zn finger protein
MDDEYLSKTELRAQTQRLVEQLRAEGETLEPILPKVKKELSNTFWGQAWNRHLMSHADYESRMAPARTALRRGEILDLHIEPGWVTAKAADLGLYEVRVKVRALDDELWQEIRADCAGQVSTLVELLSGKLSAAVMKRVTDLEHGLFPTPSDMRASCTCLDDARLCTHAAAALYAVSIRLDEQPALLFSLRGVEAEQLLTVDRSTAVTELVSGGKDEVEDLSDVFGIDLA